MGLRDGYLSFDVIGVLGKRRRTYVLDITNKRFGMLVAEQPIQPAKSGEGKRWKWRCICDCGTETIVDANNLSSGHTTSCGCYNRKKLMESVTTHGLGDTPEYGRWFAMIRRCHGDKKHKIYVKYGRTVCERWRASFEDFYEDLGIRPKGMTLERIDNNEGYHCGKCEECIRNGWKLNVEWASWAAQNRNKVNNKFFEHNGEKLIAHDWAKKYGLDEDVVRNRLFQGWSVSDALKVPIKKRGKRKCF